MSMGYTEEGEGGPSQPRDGDGRFMPVGMVSDCHSCGKYGKIYHFAGTGEWYCTRCLLEETKKSLE